MFLAQLVIATNMFDIYSNVSIGNVAANMGGKKLSKKEGGKAANSKLIGENILSSFRVLQKTGQLFQPERVLNLCSWNFV